MRYLIASLVGLLVISNVYWFYSSFDRAVSNEHTRSSQAHSKETIRILLMLNNLFSTGQSYESISSELELELGGTVLVKRKTNAIFVDSVVLVFDAGSLTSVRLLNNLSSEEYDLLEK